MATDQSDADDVLAQHLAAAESALEAAAGSSSLCSLSRSGQPMPGVKYPEGRWVALRDVRRESRSAPGIAVAVSEVRARWTGDLAHHEQAGSGPDWISYLTGGLDALDELGDSLAAADPYP